MCIRDRYLGESVTGQVYSLLSGPPKEAISRIEVLFGPQSALYGPDASQGLLNVITKHPMQESKNEINFSISSLNDPRIGGRYVKNFEKLSIDISGESKFSNEIPYGNDNNDSLILNLTDDGMSYGMKYERLVPVLVNAVKELSAENTALKHRLDAAGL